MNISCKELEHMQKSGDSIIVIDTREKELIENYPLKNLKSGSTILEKLEPENIKDETVLVCQFGILTQQWIEANDLDHVHNLIGGAQAWNEFQKSRRDLSRYSRQMALTEIGPEGQEKLLSSKVAIVGMGGLGCPAAQYLTAAGVGYLSLIDGDEVDITNLQRQPLYSSADVGLKKTDAATEVLSPLNPDVHIKSVPEFISEDNAVRLLAESDIIIDATDRFTARQILDAHSKQFGIPLVYGGLFQFEGQVSVFNLNGGPSYADVFPENSEEGGTCADAGVTGMLPGIIGNIQALEAVKILLGIEPNLSGTLLIYNGLTHNSEKVSLS
ncbi:MAG: ThiF family adenylyltransferase [Candidatus Marinimicrobia bacterium]|jgi:adenylyltransferase/sulfurtransferase|nr:ThiF family adenylyltransferase [Candidatus Neomarinimicrobiota bacterium]MDP6790165.1 ThiF family adenylyltransferase [Candidatus Neomarinimicrobiota bacterium]MDP7072090.1 ThiF family adenylyltransferase [Candidatus Neomarinimicrobiota bacterium]